MKRFSRDAWVGGSELRTETGHCVTHGGMDSSETRVAGQVGHLAGRFSVTCGGRSLTDRPLGVLFTRASMPEGQPRPQGVLGKLGQGGTPRDPLIPTDPWAICTHHTNSDSESHGNRQRQS